MNQTRALTGNVKTRLTPIYVHVIRDTLEPTAILVSKRIYFDCSSLLADYLALCMQFNIRNLNKS